MDGGYNSDSKWSMCRCLLQVYVYYELGKYYQNHKRYVRSRDDGQLAGRSGSSAKCAPQQYVDGQPNASRPHDGKSCHISLSCYHANKREFLDRKYHCRNKHTVSMLHCCLRSRFTAHLECSSPVYNCQPSLWLALRSAEVTSCTDDLLHLSQPSGADWK